MGKCPTIAQGGGGGGMGTAGNWNLLMHKTLKPSSDQIQLQSLFVCYNHVHDQNFKSQK